MPDQRSSVPLQSLCFHLKDIELLDMPVGWTSGSQTAVLHTLLVFARGSGCLHTDRRMLRFSPEQCYLLSPDMPFRLENEYDEALRCYRMTFQVIEVSDRQYSPYAGELFPGRIEAAAYPFSRLLRMIQSLHTGGVDTEADGVQRNIRFQELMGFLLEQNLQAEPTLTPVQAVKNTIRYMHDHYMHQHITVQYLAQLAHLTTWRYTPIFQRITGKKPLHYLTELRINRSKELLLHTQEPLRHIAHEVGFADEYYFNRRFRHITGLTPKQYARQMKRSKRIRDWTGHEVDIPASPERIVYYGETFGDLLALGIQPVGSDNPGSAPRPLAQETLPQVHDIGYPFNADKTMALKPDLIIFANADEKQYRWVSKIAPTVTFNSYAPLEQRMQVLGRMLGRKSEAQRWLDAYGAKAQAMWSRMQGHIRPGETASVLIYDRGGRLFVMGVAGLSSSLYHPSGFKPTEPVGLMLADGLGYAEISPRRLHEYAGDRIFMLLSAEPASRQAAASMMESPLWRSLPAAQSGQVYVIEAEKWNYGDAFTREQLLEWLPRLLSRT
ncbi:ABC transporter substrate-binding protein [Paenibacillus sp. HJL G12]|uniref:ABC transporter substrate-binding protein n=1 Tax=Paenibacillus dendrobii TaxID=2691084 RepID=A0A7X3IKL8_9BACL|nr:AraC family transcriptional regulator [Paenibacillus dendrobii]MWV45689.1 ABC transporter substrate-binding protein [Paenibacillus dendrobii]